MGCGGMSWDLAARGSAGEVAGPAAGAEAEGLAGLTARAEAGEAELEGPAAVPGSQYSRSVWGTSSQSCCCKSRLIEAKLAVSP